MRSGHRSARVVRAALVEKARVLAASGDWDQCHDLLERSIERSPKDVETLELLCIYQLAREGDVGAAERTLARLWPQVKRQEPGTLHSSAHRALLSTSPAAGADLDVTLQMAQHAHDAQPLDARGVESRSCGWRATRRP